MGFNRWLMVLREQPRVGFSNPSFHVGPELCCNSLHSTRFALDCPGTDIYPAGDLPQEKTFIRMRKKKSKHRPPRTAKERGPQGL